MSASTSTLSSSSVVPTTSTSVARPSWRTGAAAGLAAAAATTTVAAVAHAAGVSFESAPGEAIPILGFAQLTLFFTAVGVVIARVLARRARQPRRTFVRTTVVLTAASVVPDLVMPFDVASKLCLMATHLIAAAIVIPALSARLGEGN